MTAAALTLLLVEDNPGDAELLRLALCSSPGLKHTLVHVEELEEAADRLARERFDLVLLDLSLPDSHGLETLLRLRAQAPDLPIVVLTGLADEEMAVRTVHEGAQDYLVKGELDGKLLVRSLRYALERHRLEREQARLLRSEREKSEQLKLSVREAHHRIKNNLQAICDLLYLALSAETAASPQEVLRESVERVQAIALVHDLLSQHEDVQTVDARSVIERLVPMALASNQHSHPGLAVTMDIPAIRVSAKKGTTLSLIVNELVSNAAKHAFKDHGQGSLIVTLHDDCGELVLRVRDNGPGLPPDFDLDLHAHVGLQVVRVMAERDLDGRLTFTNDGGLCVEVRFAW